MRNRTLLPLLQCTTFSFTVCCKDDFFVHLLPEDYVCRENSPQIAIIDYLFFVNFYGGIFSLLAMHGVVGV